MNLKGATLGNIKPAQSFLHRHAPTINGLSLHPRRLKLAYSTSAGVYIHESEAKSNITDF